MELGKTNAFKKEDINMKQRVYVTSDGEQKCKPTTDIFRAQEQFLAAMEFRYMLNLTRAMPEIKMEEIEITN